MRYELSAVRVFTRDLDQAVDFYRDTLEMPLVSQRKSRGHAIFELSGATLVVERAPADDLEAEELVGRFLGVSFEVPDLDECHRHLSGKGVRFSSPPTSQDWGGRMAHFHDRDDNILTLVELP